MLAAFTVVALVLFLPSTPISRNLPSFWADNIPKIVLGLDLQGGMHLVLQVDRDKAVETHTQRLVDSVEEDLRRKSIPYGFASRQGISEIVISYPDERTAGQIRQLLTDEYNMFGDPTEGEGKLTAALVEDEVKRLRSWSVSQALETIRNRIDKFGEAEPVIQKQGEDQLVIQLPGL